MGAAEGCCSKNCEGPNANEVPGHPFGDRPQPAPGFGGGGSKVIARLDQTPSSLPAAPAVPKVDGVAAPPQGRIPTRWSNLAWTSGDPPETPGPVRPGPGRFQPQDPTAAAPPAERSHVDDELLRASPAPAPGAGTGMFPETPQAGEVNLGRAAHYRRWSNSFHNSDGSSSSQPSPPPPLPAPVEPNAVRNEGAPPPPEGLILGFQRPDGSLIRADFGVGHHQLGMDFRAGNVVDQVRRGSIAEAVGIQAGWRLMEVEGENLSGYPPLMVLTRVREAMLRFQDV
mmetsp:Transcript_6952/g.15849  ORF Transcript_6952/g.15849 Transcript_6952/m.15849 type:complete len:284 (+) Transcript_6952:107-958(+)|eukprot:CAMPEP_0206424482 /NCGR_PEP_ID=MMETSP0324_2-20121206/3256_1 /ASSEMBLY_ACC=CAM_ASM_000836 /TAXON_ID=2866 /ORGANISM="Crypthecodinium cohnii, Strain Seligo" /LENGTH=283 /DNA_ID=CAMNT_0053889149 /DNA_START=97 /DNA_END=944 /DNA_ORIENTATION=+